METTRLAAVHPAKRPSRVGWPHALIGLVLIVHGLVHVMGVALLLELAEPGELTYEVARPAAGSALGIGFAALWVVATVLFLSAGILLLRDRWWSPTAAVASLVSLVAIGPMATAAPIGLVVSAAVLAFAVWHLRSRGRAAALGPAPAFLPDDVRDLWCSITDPVGFLRPSDALPEPVARWLDHVAPVAADARRGALVRMHGEIRLGSWRPFRADQAISRSGFIWAAEAGRGAMAVTGHDRYAEGSGAMDWRLLGTIPVMRRADDDVTRSSAGRFAAELLVLCPSIARSDVVSWSAHGPDAAVASIAAGGYVHRITLRFDDAGRLVALSLPRWGEPDDGGFREEVFGVVFEGERRFGDLVLPGSYTAGWWPESARWADGMFFRCTIDDAAFF